MALARALPQASQRRRGLALCAAGLALFGLRAAPAAPFCLAGQPRGASTRRSLNLTRKSVADTNLEVIRSSRPPAESDAVNPLFAAHKERILERTLRNDKSPKGSVDERVVPIIKFLNNHPEYVSTSSCSGRVFFMAYGAADEGGVILPGTKSKTNLGHVRVSHDGVPDDAEAYFSEEGLLGEGSDLWFLVRPFTLDVACASLEAATRLQQLAEPLFHRGSSIISPGRDWRSIVAFQGNQNLEMPYILAGKPVFSGSISDLAELANGKLTKNWQQMDRLLEKLKAEL